MEALDRRVSAILDELAPDESELDGSDLDGQVSAILDELAPDESELDGSDLDSRVSAILNEFAPDESELDGSDPDSPVSIMLDEMAAGEVIRSAPYFPDAPVRNSLSDEQIMMRFRETAEDSTESMMQALEKQVSLREEEEEAFESWAQMARNLRGEEAEAHIARQRIIFDGGDPGTEEEFLEKFNKELSGSLQEEELDDTDLESSISAREEDSETSSRDSDAGAESQDSSSKLATTSSPSSLSSRKKSRNTASGAIPTVALEGGINSFKAAIFWWGIGLPIGALTAGGYFVSRGLSLLESVTALGFFALFIGVLVGVVSHLGIRKGRSTSNLIAAIFGKYGAIVPAGLLLATSVLTAAFLIWWAADLLQSIIQGAGLWPYEPWVGKTGGAVFIAGLVTVVSFTSRRVLRGVLLTSAISTMLGSIIFAVKSIPEIESDFDWSGPFDLLRAVSVGSVTLSLGLLVTLLLAADLSTLKSESNAKLGGFVSAVFFVVPLSAMVLLTILWTDSSYLVGRRLVTSPVGLLVDGAPNFYPIIAIVGLVLPIVGLAALLNHSLGRFVATMRIPGSARNHGLVTSFLVLATVAALLVFQIDLRPSIPDLSLTLGVFMVSVAAALLVSGPNASSKGIKKLGWFRPWTTVAVFAGAFLGLGLLDPNTHWLSWQGFLLPVTESLGVQDIVMTQTGFVASFALAIVIASLGELVSFTRRRKSTHVDST